MFKIESYITPILLSYVDKYIKNFRPEDSQVSLWGGDVSFHNLDLRLEVLEQELQLPFSFVSGHIHELLIHVPWTKLASEPITVTINTIECILKLKNEETGTDAATQSGSTAVPKEPQKKRKLAKHEIAAPPGYVESLVNKIVNNITIFCNNLILKYVEEDIVLSVNVKTVKVQSANEKWEPAFTELTPSEFTLRKLVTLSDLTICLDKRNSSGKIELYQEPLLYRCVLEMHLLQSYHSAKAKRASVTRMDLHCFRMDFSLTEQQIPMLMRLIKLAIALQGKELRPEKTASVEIDPAPENDVEDEPEEEEGEEEEEEEEEEESWAGWAWSLVPSLLPGQGDEEWNSEQQLAYSGHTFHIGVYIDQASVSFKVTESNPERSYYGPRKVKFVPFLVVQMHGTFVDIIMHGATWFNLQTGISFISLEPYRDCFCGVKEISSECKPEELLYFCAGADQRNYILESLFDPNSLQNRGQKKMYTVSWDYHLATVTESLMLERSPACAVDLLHMLEIPEDFSSERLSELGSDLEYSNLHERSLIRAVVGPVDIRLCSGLMHRLQMVQYAASTYDYGPYSPPKPEPSHESLAPVSTDDFEALEANIPVQVLQVTLFKPVIQLCQADHPPLDPAILPGHRKRRKTSRVQPLYPFETLPRLAMTFQCLDARIVKPMYPLRVVSTVSQLPDPPDQMFDACHEKVTVKPVIDLLLAKLIAGCCL